MCGFCNFQGSPLTSGLSVMSSLQDVLAGMKSPSENIVTFQKLTDLQTGFFLSYEAVDWAMDTLGIPCSELAAELFSRMITERLIVHASGKPSFPFVSGFYLYNIAQPGETRHPIRKGNSSYCQILFVLRFNISPSSFCSNIPSYIFRCRNGTRGLRYRL